VTLFENREKLHGKIYSDGVCLGSCVPFRHLNRVFVLTCFHVFSKLWQDAKAANFQEITVVILKHEFRKLELCSEFHSSSVSDILALELLDHETFDESALLDFNFIVGLNTNDVRDKKLSLVTCHPREHQIASVALDSSVEVSSQNEISGTVPKGTFFNSARGRGGALEYAGVSGSGLFIEFNSEIHLIGLLSKIPVSSINEYVSSKCLDSLKESALSSKCCSLSPNEEKPPPLGLLRDVCFLHYTDRSYQYYYERHCDSTFNNALASYENIWVYGSSGTGKTALIARNIKSQDAKHIACDLEPIVIKSIQCIFQGIVDEIAANISNVSPPSVQNVNNLRIFLQQCNLPPNTIISIDEMSCDNAEIIAEFCHQVVSLVRQYQKLSIEKSLTFVVSSIFHPGKHVSNKGKFLQSFETISTDQWDGHIEELFNLQNEALGNKICDSGKQVVLQNCECQPRLLSRLVEKIYKSGQFCNQSITKLVLLAKQEHSEYE